MLLCRSIAESNFDLAVEATMGAPLVELRADLMGLSAEQIGRLVGFAKQSIVTYHKGSSEEAIGYYTRAIDCGAWAIDVAFERGEAFIGALIDKARRSGCRVVVSHHYSTTPRREELELLAKKMFTLGADIAKIITTATTTQEALVPLGLYRSNNLTTNQLVAFAMGSEGSFTRRLSLLMGAPYTYVAPARHKATAQGQPTEEDMIVSLQEGAILEGLTLPLSLTPPCSKSEAQRAILCAAVTEGRSIIVGYTPCDDNSAAIEVARTLGAEVVEEDGRLTIVGVGGGHIAELLGRNGHTTFRVGESALTSRLTLCILAALNASHATIEGRGTLTRRNLSPTLQTLAQLGATGWESSDGHLPLSIGSSSTHLSGGLWRVDGSDSSQTISGLMMAAALLPRSTTIVVERPTSTPYIDLTANTLGQFGIGVVVRRGQQSMDIEIEGGTLHPANIELGGDWSSAAYFAAAYAIAQSGLLPSDGYHIAIDPQRAQADNAIVEVLKRAGANITTSPSGVRFMPSGPLTAFDYDATNTPDLIPTLAVVALFAVGSSRIGGLQRLSNKESNRTEALVENLIAIGAKVDIEENTLIVEGGAALHSAPLRTHSDHRIAMALTVASLFMSDKPTLDQMGCVAKSFPTFFTILNNQTPIADE